MLNRARREEGFVLVMTLLVLFLMTLALVASFQNSAMGSFISMNSLDQPTALNSGIACEQHMVRRVLNSTWTPYNLALTSPKINCQSGVPTLVETTTKMAGASASLKSVAVRFRTDGVGIRNSKTASVTDVTVVYNLPN